MASDLSEESLDRMIEHIGGISDNPYVFKERNTLITSMDNYKEMRNKGIIDEDGNVLKDKYKEFYDGGYNNLCL